MGAFLLGAVVAIAAALFLHRAVRPLAGRLASSLSAMNVAAPVERGGAPYRAQELRGVDPRFAHRLSLAAQTSAWLMLLSPLRLATLPLHLIDLVDAPHRRLGLVPDDESLVLAHLALGVLLVVTAFAAWTARRGIIGLATWPNQPVPVLRLRVLSALAGLSGASAAAATVGLIVSTPMSLYWLRGMCGYDAICAAVLLLSAAVVGVAGWSSQHTRFVVS